jgi:hypothetical protein
MAPVAAHPCAILRARLATAVTTGGSGSSGAFSCSSASHISAAAFAIVIEPFR